MAAAHPVTFTVTRPEKFERSQIFLRMMVIIVLALLAGSLIWILGAVYLAFPVLAAILISQRSAEKFLEEDGPKMTEWLRWVLALYCYLFILTDRFPTDKPENLVGFDVRAGGSPAVGSALLRLIYSIPSVFVLLLLGLLSAVFWVIAIVTILVQESYPDSLYNYQAGVMRWLARLLGYHSSLTDVYPPFALDTGAREPEAAVTA